MTCVEYYSVRIVPEIVAGLVSLDAVVEGELKNKVVVFLAKANHRLGPGPRVVAVAGGLAAAVELFVPQHVHSNGLFENLKGFLQVGDCRRGSRGSTRRGMRVR